MKLASTHILLALSALSSAVQSNALLLDELFLNAESSVSCTISELHGLAPPGSPHITTKHYSCLTDDGIPLFFDDDASALLGSNFVPGLTRLALTARSISADNRISVKQAMTAPGAVSVIDPPAEDVFNGGDGSRRLTQTGTKSVLVVRVESASHAPSQSEAQLYDDVFTDENNLRARYIECSNNQLIFEPASGPGVNNGILTVTTTTNLDGLIWTSCGDIAIAGATGINRDFTMIVCPDEVNFDRAAAWGQMPGSISWYRSLYASVPIVQVHEVGHNLGHPHSGEIETYDDKTCNMGNEGDWSDTGSAFCFNGVKTWRNGWHSSYERDINPVATTHDGSLYGINAVNDGRITTSEDVVWRVYTSGAGAYIYIMFNRKAGPNRTVPGSGDQVIVHSHSGNTYDNSYIVGSLSQGDTYTYSNWINSQTLTVSVCSITLGDPGVARVLVYTSANPLSCEVSTPAPTKSVTLAPTKSPVKAPTPVTSAPTKSPVKAPTPITSAPTKSPVKAPTPITLAPTKNPVKAPTPITSAPTKSPVTAPDENFCQDSSTRFNYRRNKKKTCKFIAKRNTINRCKFEGVADACPVTCQVGCQCFDTEGRFSRGNKSATCRWAARKNTAARCRNNAVRSNCPITCGACSA